MSHASQSARFPRFVLASGSPRRRELLREAGYDFDVEVSGVVEPPPAGFASPESYVQHLSWLKAEAVARRRAGKEWILAADTDVDLEGEILGKPEGREDAARILGRLQGTHHHVHTGVCLRLPTAGISLSSVVTSTVRMKPLSQRKLDDYLDSRLWEGKAGAYGIQDQHDPFVQAIEGSYSNIVGLPMEKLAELFACASKITFP